MKGHNVSGLIECISELEPMFLHCQVCIIIMFIINTLDYLNWILREWARDKLALMGKQGEERVLNMEMLPVRQFSVWPQVQSVGPYDAIEGDIK